jgi:hypothetical protein
MGPPVSWRSLRAHVRESKVENVEEHRTFFFPLVTVVQVAIGRFFAVPQLHCETRTINIGYVLIGASCHVQSKTGPKCQVTSTVIAKTTLYEKVVEKHKETKLICTQGHHRALFQSDNEK